MYKIEFGANWIKRMMMCVKSISFSILIYGDLIGLFEPLRGPRLSDHLSSYLFLICTEDLISLHSRVGNEKQITGIRISRGAPSINHMLFADNSILFLYGRKSKNYGALGYL